MNDAEKFIAECAEQARKQVTPPQHQMDRQVQQDKGEQIIREAVGERGWLFHMPGNCSRPLHLLDMQNNINDCPDSKSSIVAENYMVIGGHVDMSMRQKIINHKYIEFAHLVPKGKSSALEEDHRMELINRGGATFFVPVHDCETSGITKFNKW